MISPQHRRYWFGRGEHALRWAERAVPPGLRSALGMVLACAGAIGFLPILGFWMLPLGLGFIALDIPPWRRRLLAWVARNAGPAQG
jgi:hypothetical protein